MQDRPEHAHHRPRSGRREPGARRQDPRYRAGPLRSTRRARHRFGHDRRDAGPDLQPVLHDQGSRRGDRAWASLSSTVSSRATTERSTSRAVRGRARWSSATSPSTQSLLASDEIVQASLPRGHGEHVLFVDDEAPLANAARLGLERLGYRTTVFTDPAEALRRFVAAPDDFQLVVTGGTYP